MDIKRRFVLNMGTVKHLEIYIVGCGGTGSFVALHVARLAYHMRDRADAPQIDILLIDPDKVELKNIGRQNFCPAEIGQHKAYTLMLRYNAAFGLPIQAICAPLDDVDMHITHKAIMIGCVDNGKARREMHSLIARYGKAKDEAPRLFWLDAGNHDNAGQVLLGNEIASAPKISPLGYCSHLPSPGCQCPELLDTEPQIDTPAGESCAELAMRDAQSLMVNQACAGWIGVYLSRMLISRDLDIMATYFDLGTGSARSEPITGTPPEAPDQGALLWGEDLEGDQDMALNHFAYGVDNAQDFVRQVREEVHDLDGYEYEPDPFYGPPDDGEEYLD